MNSPTKAQENKVRRQLLRRGYRLWKCRRRDPHAIGFGLYCYTVIGFDAELEPEEFCHDLDTVVKIFRLDQ